MIIKWLKPRATKFRGYQKPITPGTNEIPDDVSKTLVKDTAFNYQVKLGAVVIVSGAPDEKKAPKPSKEGETNILDSVAAMKPDEAIELIKETYNLDLLNKLKLDKRKKVASAAEAQIKMMNQKKEDSGSGSGEENQKPDGK